MTSRTVDLTVMHTLHDAFRRDLDHLARAADAAGDHPAAPEPIAFGWAVFAHQLHHHHTVEDDQLWPLVRRSWTRSPDALDVLSAMEDEHDLIDPALAAVEAAVVAGDPVAEPLARVRTILVDHLAHEERDAMPLITAVVTPRDWDAFGAKQAKSLGLKGAADFFPWLLEGMDDERTEKVLGVLPGPLRWAYRRRWLPRWQVRCATFTPAPAAAGGGTPAAPGRG